MLAFFTVTIFYGIMMLFSKKHLHGTDLFPQRIPAKCNVMLVELICKDSELSEVALLSYCGSY
jgi:hypothetical protein